MFISIQLLRVIACSLVLFAHMDPAVFNFLNKEFPGGGIGVDIFFIISGFVMASSTAKIKLGLEGSVTFIIKRFIRIWPMYAIATLLFTIEMYYIKNDPIDLIYIFRSLTLLPVSIQHAEYGEIYTDPKLGLGWTLQFEMFFYVIIALLIFAKFRKPYLPALVFSIPIFYNMREVPLTPFMSVVSSPLLFEFAFGYFIYYLYIQHKQYFQVLSPYLLTSGIVLIILAMQGKDWLLWYHNMPRMIISFEHFNLSRAISWGFPAAILFCGILGCDELINKNKKISWVSKEIGDATYSLYLTHTLVLPLLLISLDSNQLLSKFVYIATPFIVAVIAHKFIENPLTIFLKKLADKNLLHKMNEA